MKKALKVLTIIFLITIFIFVALYLAGVFFYKSHFLPNTYVNEIDVQNKDILETKELLEGNSETYKLSIEGKNNKNLEITGEVFDYSVKVNSAHIKDLILAQNSWGWPFNLYTEYTVETDLNYDKSKLKKIIESSNLVVGEDVKAPVNARIEKTENGYVVIKEENGNKIDVEKTYKFVLSSIDSGQSRLILGDSEYLTADVTEQDESIISFMEKAEKLNNLIITYNFKDRKEVLDFSTFKNWVTFDEKDGISVDDSKVKQYVINLADKYDTYQKERTFKTTNNGEIKISGGIYGWQTNISETTKQLIDLIKATNSVEIEPIYNISAMERSINDIGDTYIEVSITDQHMWFYKNGELIVDTDVVTGLANGKRDTPTGVFTLWSKERDRYLRGANYKSWVNYWMPVSWDGVGIHDASWRSSFGGNIYKSNGSHGCINTPFSNVKKIYENVTTGTPVIIYKK